MLFKLLVFPTFFYVAHALAGDVTYWWNGEEYYLGKQRSTWHEAKSVCSGFWGHQSGDLVAINNKEEDIFIYNSIIKENGNPSAYIGANDILNEGNWVWNDNCKFNYTNWAVGQPDNYIKEDCAQIIGDSGKWNDVSCIAPLWFICERKRIDLHCSQPVVNWNGAQYYLGKIGSSWKDAAEFCREFWGSENGDLVSIDDDNENSFIFEIVKTSYQHVYIGGNDIVQEGKWVWNDNCSLNYKNWDFGQPSKHVNQNCAQMIRDSGKWNDVDCSTKLWFICERRNNSKRCGEPVFDWNGRQYYLGKTKTTWQKAKEFCLGFWGDGNGDLVTINDVDENEYLFEILLLNNDVDTYIGGNDIAQEGKWLWSDDCPFKYRNWDCEQPDNYEVQNCAYMKGDKGVWDDIDCETKMAFLCERQNLNTHCGETRVVVFNWNGGQYYLGSSFKTWQSAKHFCSQFWGKGNGDLISVDDVKENNFIFKIIKNYGEQNTFIGGKYIEKIGQWIWNDNCSFKYDNWNDDKVKSSDDKVKSSDDKVKSFADKNCIYFSKTSGKWHRTSCEQKLRYICERRRNDLRCGETVINWNFGQYYHGKITNNWQEAKDFCREFWGIGNGDLVVINNKEENNFLYSIINQNPKQNTYTGANRISKKEEWMWNGECPLKYTNWNESEPHNGKGEQCAYLSATTGKWNEVVCKKKLWFICERKSITGKCEL